MVGTEIRDGVGTLSEGWESDLLLRPHPPVPETVGLAIGWGGGPVQEWTGVPRTRVRLGQRWTSLHSGKEQGSWTEDLLHKSLQILFP